jgi:hypothetical protein
MYAPIHSPQRYIQAICLRPGFCEGRRLPIQHAVTPDPSTKRAVRSHCFRERGRYVHPTHGLLRQGSIGNINFAWGTRGACPFCGGTRGGPGARGGLGLGRRRLP